MDTKEYIESGILESYAMGLASEQEAREVECLTSIYPELKAELEKIQGSLEAYVNTLAVAPPKGTKERVLSAIQQVAQEQSSNDSASSKEQVKEAKEEPSSRIIKMNSYLKFAVAASVLFLIGFGYIYNQLKTDYSSLQGEMLSYQSEVNEQINSIQDSLIKSSGELEFLLDESTETILLAGTELSPDSKVRLFWNKTTKEYVIQYGNLPAAAAGTQYQLWAIADGKPVDMGVLNKSEESTQKEAIQLENIEAFAITLEKEGGSEVPTLEAMYVVGTV